MDILFEDSSLLAINKPAGRISEGPAKDGLSSLEAFLRESMGIDLYPCHRLDRDTTGVLLFAKSKPALTSVHQQFSKRQVRKAYLVCVDGEWDPAWTRIETYIERHRDGSLINANKGKQALTTFRRLAHWNGRSLLQALPKTGRTHQIRLHCAFKKCPVLGDALYGSSSNAESTMALHASELRLRHPASHESLSIQAPLPAYWATEWLKGCPFEIS